ncbi:MAG: hypothetical protein LBH80_00320 [Prevotellaceae bacterium]|jgi:hypothetical protein|nr:hypothetical protein [Prevotellaceae bacterium]
MKKYAAILFSLFCSVGFAKAQQVFNIRGKLLAEVKENKFYDDKKNLRFYVDGVFVYNAENTLIGKIDGPLLYDGQGRQIGRIEGNNMYDALGRQSGVIVGDNIHDTYNRPFRRTRGLTKKQIALYFYYF